MNAANFESAIASLERFRSKGDTVLSYGLAKTVMGTRGAPTTVQYPENLFDTAYHNFVSVSSTDFQNAIAALCAWREMRGDLYAGMAAVLHVIRNRVKAGWFHASVYDNVVAKNQFSSMTVLGDPETVLYPDTTEQQFGFLLEGTERLLAGEIKDSTNGATYYGVLDHVRSPWFTTHIAQSEHFERCATIGKTSFFREKI